MAIYATRRIQNGASQQACIYLTQGAFRASADGLGNPVNYTLQGWDTGTQQLVFWSSFGSPNLTPTVTDPQFTGAIAPDSICLIDAS